MGYISVYGRLIILYSVIKKHHTQVKIGAKSLSITYSIRKGYCSNFNRYIALLFDEKKVSENNKTDRILPIFFTKKIFICNLKNKR